jgi:hypothetical protein
MSRALLYEARNFYFPASLGWNSKAIFSRKQAEVYRFETSLNFDPNVFMAMVIKKWARTFFHLFYDSSTDTEEKLKSSIFLHRETLDSETIFSTSFSWIIKAIKEAIIEKWAEDDPWESLDGFSVAFDDSILLLIALKEIISLKIPTEENALELL